MKNFPPALLACPLFTGIPEPDLAALFVCLGAGWKFHDKGGILVAEGRRPSGVGVVVSGRVHVAKTDVWGNRNLLAEIGPGDLFAEAIACGGLAESPVSVTAAERTEALFLDSRRIASPCRSACAAHSRLIENLMWILARKNLLLVGKIEHVTRRTTREKLLSYLSERAKAAGGDREFSIPFDRQQLADYLSVERSALSAELSRMRDDGLLVFHKNRFRLRLED